MVPRTRRCYRNGVKSSFFEFPLTLPRNAFTAREVPRAGDLWRLCQDVATLASINSGGPPSRFREERVAFIVYRMTVTHHASTSYGDILETKTWVSRLRRRTLSTREVRIERAGALVAAATQEWVHVDFETMKPKQGTHESAAAFPAIDRGPSVTMPKHEPAPGNEEHRFSFEMWQTWADPLAHANHPAYVDWCDEATSRRMHAEGLDPVLLRPIAETVTFRSAVLPGEEVMVTTRRIGIVGTSAVALQHELRTERGVAAEALTVRGLAEGSGEALVSIWD